MTNFYVVTGDVKPQKKNTHAASRWFAVLVFALCVCSLAVLPYNVIKTEADAGIQASSMFNAMLELLKNPGMMFFSWRASELYRMQNPILLFYMRKILFRVQASDNRNKYI